MLRRSRQRPPGASREVPSPSAFTGRTALLRIATSEAIPLQPCIVCPPCTRCTPGVIPTLAVFRRRPRRDLATSSAANVATPALACGRHDGRLTRGNRRGGATWSSLPLDDAPGVHTLRSLDPACRSAGCFHPTAPTCRSPERPSRLSDFRTPGDRPLFLRRAEAWPSRPPEESARNSRSRTFRLGSWVYAGRQAVPHGLRTRHGRYCPGLCLLQVCGHQPVCAPCLEFAARRQPRDFRFRVLTLLSFGGLSVSEMRGTF